MPSKQDKPVAIVTGGGRGMGAAIARELSAQGYALALTSPSESCEKLAAELGAVARRHAGPGHHPCHGRGRGAWTTGPEPGRPGPRRPHRYGITFGPNQTCERRPAYRWLGRVPHPGALGHARSPRS